MYNIYSIYISYLGQKDAYYVCVSKIFKSYVRVEEETIHIRCHSITF